jgi:hypothetical protein
MKNFLSGILGLSITPTVPIKVDHRKREHRSLQYPLNHGEFKSRNQEMIKLYQTGDYSLEVLGQKYNITRERVRQICSYNMLRGDVKKILEKRTLKKIVQEYGSLEKYAEIQERRNLKRLGKAEGKWHWQYDACIDCGTTTKPFHAHGRCETCDSRYLYRTLPGRKESCKKTNASWRLRNLDKVKARQKEYFQDYYHRPGVHEKLLLKQQNYYNNPENKAKLKKYQQEYYKRPDVKARIKKWRQERIKKLKK